MNSRIFPTTRLSLRVLAWILFSVLIAIPSCKKDDPDPQTPDELLLVQGTIGPAGASLASGPVELIVPAGVFPTTSLISLYKVEGTPEFYGSPANTDLIHITGLPATYSGAFTLRLKAVAPESDGNLIVIRKQMRVQSLGRTETMDDPVPASMMDGWLTVSLVQGDLSAESWPGQKGETRGSGEVITYGTGHQVLSTLGDFQIIYPSSLVLNPQDLAGIQTIRQALTDVKQALTSTYTFDLSARTKWPLKVIVGNLTQSNDVGEPVEGLACQSAWDSGEYDWGPNSGVLYINLAYIRQSDVLRRTSAHEFFHLVQYLYSLDHAYDWMREAWSVWLECQFSTQPSTFVPDVWNAAEFKKSLFTGLQAGADAGLGTITPSRHGYGAFPVVRYLAARYGPQAMRGIWDECRNGKTPLEAISLHTADYSDWWNDFMNEYYLGEVHPAAYIDNLFANEPGTHVTLADVAKDSTFVFQRDMYDLSAMVFYLTVPTTGYSPDHNLELKVNPSTGPRLFIYRKTTGTTKELVLSGEGTVLVPNWADLAKEGTITFLLSQDRWDLTQSLTKTPVSIHGRIIKSDPVPAWTQCIMDFQLRGSLTTYDPVTQQSSTSTKTFGHASDLSGNGPMIGTMNGLTFQGTNGKEQITVTFDASGNKISGFLWTGNNVGSNLYPCNMTLEGHQMPSKTGQSWYYWYTATGLETCQVVSQFTFNKAADPFVYTLNSWSCDNNVYVILLFQ